MDQEGIDSVTLSVIRARLEVITDDVGTNATILFQQTVPFNMATLLTELIAAGGTVPDFKTARSVSLEFDTSGAGETWLTEIVRIKKKELNSASEEAGMRIIEGTARNMGIEVVD